MALFSRRAASPDEGGPDSTRADSQAATAARAARRRTVGQLLRETRETFGSDIPRVATALRIRPAYLEAIESGRYDNLPGPAYALGFVRAYAVHLGLDGDEAVRRFKLEAEGYDSQHDLSFPVPLAERSIPGWSMLLAAVLFAVCGYGLWFYLSSTARPRPERVAPIPAELADKLPPAPAPAPPPSAPISAQAADVATAVPAPPPAAAPEAAVPASPNPGATAALPVAAPPSEETAPVAAIPSAPPPEPPAAVAQPAPPQPPALPTQTAALPSVPTQGGATPVPDQPHEYGLANGQTRILIRAHTDSWIQVYDRDHVPIFTRTLRAGDTYRVPDRAGLTMRTGKSTGIEISLDGRPVPPIGSSVSKIVLDPARLMAGTAAGG
jgi:cytoskeleton protein RodZ